MGSHVSFFSCTHAYDFHSSAAVSSCLNRASGHAEPPSFDLDTYHPLSGTYHLRIYGRKADKFGEDRSIPLRLLAGPGCAARFHHFSQIHQALRIHTQPGCWQQHDMNGNKWCLPMTYCPWAVSGSGTFQNPANSAVLRSTGIWSHALRNGSEGESKRKLHHARIAGKTCDFAKAARVHIVRGKPEIRRIQKIESLPAEFEAASLAEVAEGSRKRKIHVRHARAAQVLISPACAQPARWRGESAGVKPLIHCPLVGRQGAAAEAVGQGIREAATYLHDAVVVAGEDREGTTCVEGGDTAGAPAAEDVRDRTLLDQMLPRTKRQFVQIAEGEPLAEIEVAVSTLLAQVMLVLQEAIGAAAADQMFLHLINRVRPRVGGGEREVMAEALLGAS